MKKFLEEKEREEHPPGTWYVTKQGELNYHSIPENKKLVVVEPGPPEGKVIVLGDWHVTSLIHIMSEVIFWSDGIAYTFQVLPSGSERYGKFSLISKEYMECQPGASARTKSSSIGNMANLK